MDTMVTTQEVMREPEVATDDGLPPVIAEVSFPSGLIGCANWKRFELRGDFNREPVGLLTCLDDPERMFFVSPVEYAAPGGLMRFTDEDTRALRQHGVGVRDDVLALVTLNIDDAGNLTANLLGPLVVDLAAAEAQQIVLTDVTLSTRHRFLADLSDGAD